jgi:hypothetical protein
MGLESDLLESCRSGEDGGRWAWGWLPCRLRSEAHRCTRSCYLLEMLQETPGFKEFDERRKQKYDKVVLRVCCLPRFACAGHSCAAPPLEPRATAPHPWIHLTPDALCPPACGSCACVHEYTRWGETRVAQLCVSHTIVPHHPVSTQVLAGGALLGARGLDEGVDREVSPPRR